MHSLRVVFLALNYIYAREIMAQINSTMSRQQGGESGSGWEGALPESRALGLCWKPSQQKGTSRLPKHAYREGREPRSSQTGQERSWDSQAEEGQKSTCLVVTIFPVILPVQTSSMLISIKNTQTHTQNNFKKGCCPI